MDWTIYEGGDQVTAEKKIVLWLKSPPPWRRPGNVTPISRALPPMGTEVERRGRTYVSSGADEIRRVNVALLLRRPLLVTGRPGIGKTTLAYNIAYCLGLGPPLRWEIHSQSTLREGLYEYDAVGHLHASQTGGDAKLDAFIRLGPLGTALLPTEKPRVLLIDEIDKASFDLPHDLLHVFEEGGFDITELTRNEAAHRVFPCDSATAADRVDVGSGSIRSLHHPVVVMTSNGEREFPEPFLRRCVRLEIESPTREVLLAIVRNQLEDSVPDELLERTLEQLSGQATDVLLQALFLQTKFRVPADETEKGLKR
ncbi:MAG: MoxR family ATPase [Myxococcales bacterium]